MRGFYKFYKPHLILGLICTLLLTQFYTLPARAGDPDDEIGPTNPNLLVCVDKGGSHLILDLESDAFEGSDEEDTLSFDEDAEVDLEELEEDCDDAGGRLEFLQQSQVEGFVFEFHPDPNGPGGWTGVPSQDVPVVISGPGFEAFTGSDKNGFYYFPNLGTGPVTLNLRLPPDAHAINPNVSIVTSGGAVKYWIHLAFYRGDVAPPVFDFLRLPAGYTPGGFLPPNSIIEEFFQVPGEEDSFFGIPMPNVGGILEQEISLPVIVLATLLVISLPAAGIVTLYKSRSTKTDL